MVVAEVQMQEIDEPFSSLIVLGISADSLGLIGMEQATLKSTKLG